MEVLLDTLNKYSNLLLVIITAIYAYLTWRMAAEMERARIADLRPYIIVDIDLVASVFYLVIRNRGKSAAEMVKLRLDREVEGMWHHKLTELPLFKSGVAFFNPGKEYVISLGPHWNFLNEKSDAEKYPKTFMVTVEYKYLNGHVSSEATSINLEEFLNTRAYPNESLKAIQSIGAGIEKQMHSIAKNTEQMAKLTDIASPTGLDISQGTLYRMAGMIDEATLGKIKFDLNLTTLMEFVELLGIELNIAKGIVEKRYAAGYFESFDALSDIDGITEEMLNRLKKRTFICIPNF